MARDVTPDTILKNFFAVGWFSERFAVVNDRFDQMHLRLGVYRQEEVVSDLQELSHLMEDINEWLALNHPSCLKDFDEETACILGMITTEDFMEQAEATASATAESSHEAQDPSSQGEEDEEEQTEPIDIDASTL